MRRPTLSALTASTFLLSALGLEPFSPLRLRSCFKSPGGIPVPHKPKSPWRRDVDAQIALNRAANQGRRKHQKLPTKHNLVGAMVKYGAKTHNELRYLKARQHAEAAYANRVTSL